MTVLLGLPLCHTWLCLSIQWNVLPLWQALERVWLGAKAPEGDSLAPEWRLECARIYWLGSQVVCSILSPCWQNSLPVYRADMFTVFFSLYSSSWPRLQEDYPWLGSITATSVNYWRNLIKSHRVEISLIVSIGPQIRDLLDLTWKPF